MSRNVDKRKPLGRALDWSDDDLDRMAEITDDDMDAALAEATPAMREVLDAEDDGDTGTNS